MKERAAYALRVICGGALMACSVFLAYDFAVARAVSAAATAPPTEETDALVASGERESQTDWRLVLVNSANPIPDSFEVTLTRLKNGQAVDTRIYPELQRMMDAMRADGLKPLVCASYRTREKQSKLFRNNVATYKRRGFSDEEAAVEAAQWVAPPGTSEHHTGLAVDIVSTGYQLLDEKQESTPEQLWLIEHCAEYGFILRYPRGKSEITGISYEPWHYRYVGAENAKKIMSAGICLETFLSPQVTGDSETESSEPVSG